MLLIILGASALLIAVTAGILALWSKFRRRQFIVKKGFKESLFYRGILSKFYPKKDSKVYKYTEKIIKSSLVNVDVEVVYNIKFAVCAAAAVLYLLIGCTNISYRSKEILEEAGSRADMIFSGRDAAPGNAASRGANVTVDENNAVENERYLFDYLTKEMDRFDVNQAKKETVLKIIEAVRKSGIKVKEDPELLALRLYGKLKEFYELRNVDYENLALLALFAFFAPEIFLLIRGRLLKHMAFNEFMFLEVAAVMAGKVEPVKVEEILKILSEHSRLFKRHIDEIRFKYFDVKGGHERAFESVIQKVGNKDFRYLLKTLQQASEFDLKISVQNLENQMASSKEFRKIKEAGKLKKKDVAAILVVLFILGAMCMYVFAPFSKLIEGFNL